MICFARSAATAAALVVATIATGSFAAVITIEQPTPVSAIGGSLTGPGGALDSRIGAGVPNTGGVAPEASTSAPLAAGASAPAPLATTTNAQMALQTLETTNAELVAIAMLGASSPVRVVLIGSADSSLKALADARGAKSAEIGRLQDAIAANVSFKADLAAKNIDLSKIVAADVSKDGLTLYAMV